MADEQPREDGLIENIGLPTLNSNTAVVTDNDVRGTDSQTVCGDLLEEAFHDADNFNGNSVSYPVSDGVHDAASAAQVIVHTVVSEGSLGGEILQSSTESTLYGSSYSDVGSHAQDHASLPSSDLDGVTSPREMETMSSHPQLESSQTIPEESVESSALSVTLLPSNQASGAPLGSSQNPIRIIQQGNQYTPVQQLTADQLQQIMQVVQQQQLTRSAEEGGGHSILFNPQTNTRIVYRVIYPSELHKNTSVDQTGRVTLSQGQQTGVNLPKRIYRKRQRGEDEDENKMDGPELSKEEKEARKKHRPRTRSGRVSKPPKHMVQDYKHIHVLDWDEDYDDSDGGYSDFKCSDEEGRESQSKKESSDSPEIFQGLGSTRPKNFKCDTCDKAYIGRAGLGRHYRLHPSHGSLPPETDADKAERTNGIGSTGSLSEDSNTQDSLPSVGNPSSCHPRTPSYTRTRGRRPHRGRYGHLQDDAPLRRKAKLREFIRDYEDEELMEVVLPRLANVITMWEFLLMKVERGEPAKPQVDNIYQEFEELYKQVQKICQEYLLPVSADETEGNAPSKRMKIQNHPLAQALGLGAGTYEVRDMPCSEENSFHYKYLTIEPMGIQGKRLHERRTVEIVTPDELVSEIAPKRSKMLSLLTNTTVTVPELADHVKSRGCNHSDSVTSTKQCVAMAEPLQVSPMTASQPHSQKDVVHSQGVIQTRLAPTAESSQPAVLPNDLNSISCAATSVSPSSLTGVQVIFRNTLSAAMNDSTLVPIMSSSENPGQEAPEVVTASAASLLPQESIVTMSSSGPEFCSASDSKCIGNKDRTVDVISKPCDEHASLNCQSSKVAVDQNGLSEASAVSNSMELIAESQVIDAGQLESQVLAHTNIFQTDDGYFIIQNPDGIAYQVQSVDGNMTYEAVQAVMAMQEENHLESDGQLQDAMDS